MFKFLRNRLQSLNDTQINILTAILVLVNVGIIIFWIQLWANFTVPKNIVHEKPTPMLPELLRAGNIGELTDDEMEERGISPIPSVIFNTSGTITQVKTDHLLVEGSNLNFVDKEPRTITVLFNESTQTAGSEQAVKHEGFDGLDYLEPGMKILIESNENIRGKVEFYANYINIL